MDYSEVVNSRLILSKKEKYTMRHVHATMAASLFLPYKGRTLTLQESISIVKASAKFHNTEYCDSLDADFKAQSV